MDHAAAHEALEDIALEPHRLRRLESDRDPRSLALREHLGDCRDCRAELDAWRRVYGALDIATAAAAAPLRSLDVTEVAGPSPELRRRTMAAVRERVSSAGRRGASSDAPPEGAPAPSVVRPIRRRSFGLGGLPRRSGLGWLAAAAALTLAIGFGGLAVQRSGEADHARAEAAELGSATAVLDHILAQPTHWVVTLRTADGAAGGTLAWSDADVVVLTSALDTSPGTTYRCWIEQGGSRTPVGLMSFSGGIGYWAGSMTSWGTFRTGGRFGVTAVDAAGVAGPAVLVGQL